MSEQVFCGSVQESLASEITLSQELLLQLLVYRNIIHKHGHVQTLEFAA